MSTRIRKIKTIISPVKIVVKIIVVALWLVLISYLIEKQNEFPAPPPGSFQSQEEADTEALVERRAYFTDLSREEVIQHYKSQMNSKFNFMLLRLNYPPEDAQTLIRDQTRSTFLEELAYPMRESVYVNGFEPKVAKDDIWYKGVHYRQKITIRYVPNRLNVKIAIAAGILIMSLALVHEFFSGVNKDE